MRRILIFALLVIASSTIITAQTNAQSTKSTPGSSLQTALIAKEKAKWEALQAGRWLSLKDMFAEDFLSLGYEPDGTVKMTTKAQSFSRENRLPPGIEFTLSDFKVISANKDSAVITYVAAGPIKVHATSVWAKRGREWKTVFYQATMIR